MAEKLTRVPIALGLGLRLSETVRSIGTRYEVCVALGIGESTLYRWISEDNMPPFDIAAQLCRLAGVRMQWLAFDGGPTKMYESLGWSS